MRIKSIAIAKSVDERIELIFKQLGAHTVQLDEDQEILAITTTADVMAEKMEIAYEQLRRLGYERKTVAMKHFWYISDTHGRMPTITVESQGSEGFVKQRHEFRIYW